MIKKILLIGLLLGLVAGGVGYYLYNKPLDSVKSMKAEVSLSASKLLEAYEENESSANQLYLDKVISVEGVVGNITQSDGKVTVYLTTNNDMSTVICELEESDDKSKIVKGDKINIKGICSGYLMDVVLVRCIIEKKIKN